MASIYQKQSIYHGNEKKQGLDRTKIHHLISSNIEKAVACCRFAFTLLHEKNSMIGVMSFPDSQLILSDSFNKEPCLVITNHANRL